MAVELFVGTKARERSAAIVPRMNLDVVLLPSELQPGQLAGRAVAIFDVLRATTTMAAALSAGVKEIRIFPDVAAARAAAAAYPGPHPILCGEAKCLPPPGFDLGNSPGAFHHAAHAGRVAFMSTTNGTRAILAAKEAAVRFTASLVNAAAAAAALASSNFDVTLLCAGTGGRVAMEDVLGCGAVIEHLHVHAVASVIKPPEPGNDAARMAHRLFLDNRHRLKEIMADAEGGRNVIGAGLAEDVHFAAQLDALNIVGVVKEARDGPPDEVGLGACIVINERHLFLPGLRGGCR